MTKAWDAEIDLDRAAIAYGCNRETMKKHYIRKEALAVADAVFLRVQGRTTEANPQDRQQAGGPPQEPSNGHQEGVEDRREEGAA
ncbi:MAG: hypothetical protein K2X38_02270 [Gemmataceae bacterium]|nr:hypothetical protein [Gemmataceae bacterium]